MLDLARCGLAKVNNGGTLEVRRTDFGAISHWPAPDGRGPLWSAGAPEFRRGSVFASSNCSHRHVSAIGISVKFSVSCGMALLVFRRYHGRTGNAAEESIDETAELKQVVQRAGQFRTRWSGCGRIKIGPCGRDQRLAPIRQNENELQVTTHVRVPEDLQRLSLERVMRTGDRYSLREVLTVGSVWWFPSIKSDTIGWSSSLSIGSQTSESFA